MEVLLPSVIVSSLNDNLKTFRDKNKENGFVNLIGTKEIVFKKL